MLRIYSFLMLTLIGVVPATLVAESVPAPRPNIVLIYADDIGWGDLGCYGAKVIPTPNIDRLAAQGARFNSAYCTSATCTPSRYSMLTGEYAWRRKGTGVLPGDAALIIPTTRPTVATVLRDSGYATAVIGKWHLGLGPRKGAGGPALDWNKPIAPGPREVGFTASFIMAATGDRVPCVYVNDGRVVGLDANDPIQVSYERPFPADPDLKSPELRRTLRMDWSHGHNQGLINGVGRIGWMRGGRAAVWDDTTMGDVFAAQACAWIKTQAQSKQPFFLFYAAHENHVPRVVHPRHVGKTPLGPRGDAIVAFDEQVGQLMEALEKAGVADQTLVLVTSDNGPVLDDGYQDEAFERNRAAGHLPAGPFRGGKYSAHQGGTRVPLVVRWAHVVPSGLVVESIVSQVDFPALFARVAGGDPSPFIKLDSANLDATSLLSGSARDHVVSHASGNRFSLRVGEWLYLREADAQNFTTFHGPGYRSEPGTQGEQLFNLKQDPGERVNLAERHPEKVEELRQRLKQLQDRGLAQPLPL